MKQYPINATVTFALWSAVLGCFVWGINATQAATGVSVITSKEVTGSETNRITTRSSVTTSNLTSISYLYEFLRVQHQVDYIQATYTPHQNLNQAISDPKWVLAEAHGGAPFITVKNRWSLGFH